MSGFEGWREGSRYRTAAAPSTPFSSRGYLWDGNSTREEAENPQKLTASEEEKSNQESAYRQQQEQYSSPRVFTAMKSDEIFVPIRADKTPPNAAERCELNLKCGANCCSVHFCVNPYVLITPNETRRNKLQQIAKKELDDLERWKEEHRPRRVKVDPQKLGGMESEAQARQKQQMMLMQSKYQQKHKREEYIRAKKAAEEAEILKMKAIQREKAERLEVKKKQQEMQRREMFFEDQYYKTNELLNRLDLGLPKSDSCQIAARGPESTAWTRSHAYKQALREDENRRLEEMKQEQRRKTELMEFKKKHEEEARTRAHQNEQRRVNNAFLDRLQNKTQHNCNSQPGYSGSLDYLSNSAWGPNYLE